MISFFRSFFQSKIGLFITFLFVALIAVAFAASDITGTGSTFGGIGNENVADVGGNSITANEFSTTVTNAFNQTRQDNPQLDMVAFADQGAIDSIMEQLVGSYAASAFGQKYGLAASKRLVDSEIAGIQAFRGADGRFSEQLFRSALQQQGLTESRVRDDIARALIGDQLLVPATFGVKLPAQIALPYAGLVLEGREGSIALVPSVLFAPQGKPTEAQLKSFYAKNGERYRVPERRVIRSATFLSNRLRDGIKVSDAEIATLYKSRASEFVASENRDVEQLIVPTEAAAKAIADKVNAGTTLFAAARAAGLEPIELGMLSKAQLRAATSATVADAAFAASKGSVAKPARSGLGWHVVKVNDVLQIAGRSLAQTRSQLETEISQEKLREAISDFTAELEDRIADGASLADLASENNLTLQTSPELLVNGLSPTNPEFVPIGAYQAILPVAFGLEEDAGPQLVEVQEGIEYALFEVQEIKPSAPPPLARIRANVEADYLLSQGSLTAKKLADTMAKSVRAPADLDKAISAAPVRLPNIEKIATNRQTMMQQDGRVPPPVALLFSMAEGTTKVLEAPNKAGWFVVHLSKINRGDASKVPELLSATRTQLAQIVANEYGEQLANAIKASVKVKRNPAAVKRVTDQLTGRNRDN
ncbi:SurA N-terminal domain-containing protein [Blastomonas sp.]|uniref:peptidylprolyl isomerase n=1 Tax=Blastomonas sp. TaxID=1909299 RepID=UPI0035932EE9